MVKKLILLKIGGGVITDKSRHYGLREDVLTRLVKEIGAATRKLKDTYVIVGNGAGSFAHFSAKEYRTAEGFVNTKSRLGMGWVRHDAVKLNQIVFEQFLAAEVPVFSFSPSSFLRVKNGSAKDIFIQPILDAMIQGMVPLVYGDVMVDAAKGCGIYSTERVFDELAKTFRELFAVRIIHISAEDGVYRKDQASVFEMITEENLVEVEAHVGGSSGVDVTGGMLHKVKECLEMAKLGVQSEIINGLVARRVEYAILGQAVKGTRIG